VTQLNEEQNTQEITSSDDNLPAEQESGFIEIGNQKVQLDIEDAPFLTEPEDEPTAEIATTSETAVATVAKDEADAEPKSKKKLIIIIGAALVLLIALAVGAFLFFGGKDAEVIIPQNIIVVPSPPAETLPTSFQIKLDPFWIDLENDQSGAKFLVGTFVVAVELRSVKKEIETNIKIVRDAIYYYLIGVDVEFLLDLNNAEEIRAGIGEILAQYVRSGPITDIYFDSFLMK